jgi:hypothetical protein
LPFWKKKGVEQVRLWLALGGNKSLDDFLSQKEDAAFGEARKGRV